MSVVSQQVPPTVEVDVMGPEEAGTFFEGQCQELLGVTSSEFLVGLRTGEYSPGQVEVSELLMILPFAQA